MRKHIVSLLLLTFVAIGAIVEHNKQLLRWERTCNYVRPHQGIDYLNLNEYYRNWLENTKGKGGNVSLTY